MKWHKNKKYSEPSQLLKLLRSSQRLSRMLLPGAGDSGPYEVLDYDATLVLDDARGLRATFRRRQTVRFLRSGVSAVLDQYWGDGVVMSEYDHSAGPVEDTFRDEGRRYLVIGLQKPVGAGSTLGFSV